jgi:hypothetical protein
MSRVTKGPTHCQREKDEEETRGESLLFDMRPLSWAEPIAKMGEEKPQGEFLRRPEEKRGRGSEIRLKTLNIDNDFTFCVHKNFSVLRTYERNNDVRP